MQWTTNRVKDGDLAVSSFFAWKPVRVYSETAVECRWLEMVTVRKLRACGKWWIVAFL